MIQLPLNVDYSGKVVVVTGAGGLIMYMLGVWDMLDKLDKENK